MPNPFSAQTWQDSPWSKLLIHTGGLFTVLYAYMWLVAGFGGFSADHIQHQFIEFGLVLYLYGLCYTALKPRWWRSVLAVMPVLLLYLVNDIYYLALGKVFRVIDTIELPGLLDILPLGYSAGIIAALALPLGLFLLNVDYRRPLRIALWLLPLVLIMIAVEATPSAFTRGFETLSAGIVKYSDGKSVENNGRLAMLAYREAQRSNALAALAPYYNRQQYDQQATALAAELRPHSNRHNIYVVVLESFLDPRLFDELGFSSPPTHPAFDKLFGDKLGLSLSPVFGGSTAQAEFEVLCGVPAFEQLSSVEFNVFSGAAAHCLPGTLKDIGYRSVATNPYKPNFFNALPAYQGMGFSENYFPKEYAPNEQTYLHVGNPGVEEYIFDKSLFDQNLDFIRSHLREHPDQPLFNYVLTIYGHTPHILNPEIRPERIKLDSKYPDDHLVRSVNQFYYRTEAIAAYINQLLTMDKESLIILVSDHVPPLRNGPNTYNALRYMGNREKSYYYNRIAIIENGQPKVFPVIHHYEIRPIILNYLSDGAYCSKHSCAFADSSQRIPREDYLDRYLSLMAHAAK